MNSSRMNKLEELGRVDSEKADTSKGKKIFQKKNLELLENLKLKGGKISTFILEMKDLNNLEEFNRKKLF